MILMNDSDDDDEDNHDERRLWMFIENGVLNQPGMIPGLGC